MKHAWLVIAHNEWGILQRLISSLDAPDCDFYIHIDKKVRKLPALRAEKGRLTLLENRMDVRWGHVSIVQCELLLLETALARGGYDYYHIISGATLPLKPFSELDAFFDKQGGRSVLSGLRKDEAVQETLKMRRYSCFLRDFQSTNPFRKAASQWLWRACIAAQKKLGIEANRGKVFYKASQWLSLTEEAARYLCARKEPILKTYRRAFCGDEYFIPSELMASPLQERLINDDMYLFVKMNRASPDTYPLEKYDELTRSGYLFARKFSEKS